MARSYDQYCAIAKALDVLGDRWALLLVRDLLLFGPQRYTELLERLPGMSTDMLATRLRELEAAGIVTRPGDQPKVYDLTDRGRDLLPVLEALARWGLAELGKPAKSDTFEPAWLTIPIRALYRPDRAKRMTLRVRFVMRRSDVFMKIDGGALSFPSELEDIDVTVAGPPDALVAAVARPGTRGGGRLDISGAPDAVTALTYVLGLSDEPPQSSRVSRGR